jgi:NAD(P)-dependent dehydrogenase (short-subunit alcohol dehydrogenase family)
MAKGIEALTVVADVTQADQVQHMVDTVLRRWGR